MRVARSKKTALELLERQQRLLQAQRAGGLQVECANLSKN
jgi:hypothetical protein